MYSQVTNLFLFLFFFGGGGAKNLKKLHFSHYFINNTCAYFYFVDAIKKRIKSRINIQSVSTVTFVPQYRLALHRIHHLKKVTAPCIKIPTQTEQDKNMDAIMNLYKPS